MKYYQMCSAVIFLMFYSVNLHAQSAQEILQRSDAIRNAQVSTKTEVQLTQYENNKPIDQTSVTVLSYKEEKDQFLSMVHLNQPLKDKGKILLRKENILWIYDPRSKTSVRISPRQRLMGNTSNGDLMTANFVEDYSAELTGEEVIVNGDKQQRHAFILHLTAKNSFATYKNITLWVDKENMRPIKAMFYVNSGNLLKVAWYRGWKTILGEIRPTEVVIVDGINPKSVTIVATKEVKKINLPKTWFNKEWLPQFNLARDVP